MTDTTSRGRLIVVGDSFSVEPYQGHDTTVTWARQVAQQLNLRLWNLSQYGVSQDWCFEQLRMGFIAEQQPITAEDRIIVMLTHPNRYWFFQDLPHLSNSLIIDVGQYLNRQQATAVHSYFEHIQRPQLDTLQMVMRLGWLAHQIDLLNLPPPLMIKCFDMDVRETAAYPQFTWAQGDLFQVQLAEFAAACGDPLTYFGGTDLRYNHLCLVNHQVLALKLINWFQHGTAVNLAEDFHRDLIQPHSQRDAKFCSEQFEDYKVQLPPLGSR